MTSRERVRRAITFDQPDRVPVVFWNRDHERGDILLHDFTRQADGRSEWGYQLESLGDGTMGQPRHPVIAVWDDFPAYRFPNVDAAHRREGVDAFKRGSGDRYLIAGLGITGFNLYTFLRGFANAMMDFVAERENAERLLDGIMGFEMELMTLAAGAGFDGVHLADDWGTQAGPMIDPTLWRDLFKPRYRAQVAHAHGLGLHVWFHSCGRVQDLVPDFHEIGVDVMNISQPNANDLSRVGEQLRGRQCFMEPISYQTVSISGTRDEIFAEAQRLYTLLGTPAGGFIGYVEEYGCMGMSETNYQACADAFRAL